MSAIVFFEVDEHNKTLEILIDVPAKRDVTFYSAHGCIYQSAELNTQTFRITSSGKNAISPVNSLNLAYLRKKTSMDLIFLN